MGATFEGEARIALQNTLLDVCPFLENQVVLRSRELESGGRTREADIFGFIEEKSQEPCKSVPSEGIRTVEVADAVASHPPLTADRLSPSAPSREPKKYLMVEVYAGKTESKRIEKLMQLDSLLLFTKQRWEDRSGSSISDITSIIGVAGLVVSPGDRSRAQMLSQACAEVLANCAPLHAVRRMMQAGRFFIMVLDETQMPNTSFQRTMSVEQRKMSVEQLRQAGMLVQLQQSQQQLQQSQQQLQQSQQQMQQSQQQMQQSLRQLQQQLDAILQRLPVTPLERSEGAPGPD